MFVSQLALSHFRSHRRAQLALDGRPVVLFGSNGAGKTNLLEAVSLLSPGRGLRRAAPEELSRRPEALGWRVTARLSPAHGASPGHEIETGTEGAAPRSLRIDGKAAPQAALARILRVLWLVPAMDRLWTEAPEGRRRFLDRLTMSFFPAHAEETLAYDKAMRARNRLLRDGVEDMRWYAALEAQMARHGAAIGAARRRAIARLAGAMEDAETRFPAARLALTGAEGEAAPDEEDALAEALRTSRTRDRAAGRSLVGPHRDDLAALWAEKDMPAASCSTGEQKALLISLVLANARALAADTGAPPVLLLDEVAAHLDAGRRADLYDEVCALGAQAWMTGTGADLFAGLGDRAQAYDVTEAGGLSRIEETGLP